MECAKCSVALYPDDTAFKMEGVGVCHEACVRCHYCDTIIDGPVSLIEKRFLHADCAPLLSQHCKRCRLALPEQCHVLRCDGAKYHEGCFLCETCGQPLDSVVVRHNRLFHPECVGPHLTQHAYLLPTNQVVYPLPPLVLPFSTHPVVAHRHPLVKALPNFLSAQECAALIELATPLLQPSYLKNNYGVANPDRTSQSAFLPNSPALAPYYTKAASLLGCSTWNFHAVQVGRYQPGQKFGEHYDSHPLEAGSDPINTHQRIATLLVYLNDLPEGKAPIGGNGHTIFPLIGVSIPPKRGAAVYFQNNDQAGGLYRQALHCGAEVVEGEKWICNLWQTTGRPVGAPEN
eukprot:NODE_2038_length_1297_cov_17.068376_g1939_i0.p1 GENE.NODE_2038_length_1297_cov_17.068376_g1939_i0~~NODE_2038_length_1297_cov_17.068376_g1939_i0.p1  ORF type:complete len:353 (-),score=70.92 NODE_2038_length_1297_cov_17.068376_g1939_i0:239-1276(-)